MNKSLKKTIQIIFRIFIVTIIVYVAAKLGTIAFDFGYRVFTEPAVAEAPARGQSRGCPACRQWSAGRCGR